VSESLPSSEKKQLDREQARAILRAALTGGEVSREQVREVFEVYDIGPRATDPAERAESAMISLATGGNLCYEEELRARLAFMRKSLGQSGDGELERLLIHRVALAWLALASAEELRALKWRKGIVTADADFWDRHVSRAHTEFLRATKTLAQVRKLTQPTIVNQLNVAEQQQINVLGQTPPEAEGRVEKRSRG